LVKVRRQSNPQNFNANEDIWARSGFNPFRPDTSRVELGGSGSTGFDSGSGGNEACLFGASGSNVGFN
jgi:DnaJ family protein C protein 7